MISESSKTKYTCKACHKVFVRENAYMVHNCKQMKREAELKTQLGQTAWDYYQTWMKCKKRIPPSATAFMSSNYFRTFMNFAKFVKQIKLPGPDKFIKLMVHKDYPPSMWTMDEIYTQYIDFLDSTIDPTNVVLQSIDTLLKYADNLNDVSEVFDRINPNELLQLIRVRQLSPWLLLYSKKFGHMWKTRLNNEQQSIMESLIHIDNWGDKLQKIQPSKRDEIKRFVTELGI